MLLVKLETFGFRKSSLKLISRFLSNRKHRKKGNSAYSNWEDLLFGVPQGSGSYECACVRGDTSCFPQDKRGGISFITITSVGMGKS